MSFVLQQKENAIIHTVNLDVDMLLLSPWTKIKRLHGKLQFAGSNSKIQL